MTDSDDYRIGRIVARQEAQEKVLDKMTDDLKEVTTALRSIQKLFWMVIGAGVLLQVLLPIIDKLVLQ